MAESLQQILFFIFAAVAVVSALLVVTMNNPVRSALALVLVFFATAGIWILSMEEFLALILVLVYVGAVMTLFLFLVMMINLEVESMKKHFIRYAPLGLFIIAVMVGLMIMVMPDKLLFAKVVESHPTLSNTAQLGMVLYTDYVYATELAAVLLLVSIIAAIALAHRPNARGKRQTISKQVMTRKEERVELISMPPEQQEGR
jgi:NADH-quinone oxidoreductase subunit J